MNCSFNLTQILTCVQLSRHFKEMMYTQYLIYIYIYITFPTDVSVRYVGIMIFMALAQSHPEVQILYLRPAAIG